MVKSFTLAIIAFMNQLNKIMVSGLLHKSSIYSMFVCMLQTELYSLASSTTRLVY